MFAYAVERAMAGTAHGVTGLGVTAPGGSLQIDVAAGTGVANSIAFTYAGGNVTPAAAASDPRYDLVIWAAGAVVPSIVAGVPAPVPVPGTLPAGAVLLGLAFIPPSATDYTTGGFVADYVLRVAIGASAISILDAANDFAATNVEGALAELQSDAEDHLADAADAHDASAVSILDTAGDFTATDVEGALAEIQTDLETLLPGHGASLHANRTRTIWLSLDGAAVSFATPTRGVQGTNAVYAAWTFNATDRALLIVQVLIPADWVSGVITPKFYWTNLGAGAGDVYWELSWKASSAAEDLNVVGEADSPGTVTAAALNVLKISAGTPITPTAGELIVMRFGRDGTSGVDNLANSIGLVGIELEYTADM